MKLSVVGLCAYEEEERIIALARMGFNRKSARMVHEYRDTPEDEELQEELFRDLAALQRYEERYKRIKNMEEEYCG